MSTKKNPKYHNIDSILVPAAFARKCFLEALEYKPRAGDIIIDTYPKSGTTWTQCIVLHILRKGIPLEDPSQFFYASPFIDMIGNHGIDNMIRPGALKTHLPYNRMPYSPDAKYIYVARNPFDVCVSLYYHTKSIPRCEYWDAEFDDFFELFMNGEVEYNDYFDHLMSWYPHLKDKNVFFTTYESLKKDTKGAILDLARFIGKEYVDLLEKDNVVLNNILKYSSFGNMKADLSAGFNASIKPIGGDDGHSEGHRQHDECSSDFQSKQLKREFFRKGIVGDWKNHFSEEQFQQLNDKFETRTKGTELYSLLSP